MINLWITIGFVSHLLMYFGIYKPFWLKYYNKDVSVAGQLVMMILCVGLGFVALFMTIVIFIGNFEDLWKDK